VAIAVKAFSIFAVIMSGFSSVSIRFAPDDV
jgi:hypothetical protein